MYVYTNCRRDGWQEHRINRQHCLPSPASLCRPMNRVYVDPWTESSWICMAVHGCGGKFAPSLWVGFEPTRVEPIWFLVKRLNHSAIAAHFSGGSLKSNFVWHQELYYDLVTGKKARFKLKIDMQDTKYFWCHGDVIFSKMLYLMAKCLLCTIGRVAQWIRRPTSNRKIVGSIPIVVILHISSIAHWNLG